MKHSELIKKLKKAGCFLIQHGARHDQWLNPANGHKTWIPRHGSKEIKKKTERSILDALFS